MRAPIHTRRHPAVWEQASGVVIRHPGKDDHRQWKAYCSISLLSCMGKVVKKVVTDLLSEEAERRRLHTEGVFRRRKGRSAIDAAAIMVDRAHTPWTNGRNTGFLLMDIKPAFPSVAKGRQVNIMKVRQMDGELIQWTERFPSDRQVDMILEGNAMEKHQVEAGVPQGLPVSPIIIVMYTSGLIKWVEEYLSEVEGLSFLDDLSWLATRSDVNQVVMIHQRCPAKSIEWASRPVLQFDTATTEVALFTHSQGHKKHLRP